MFLTRYSTRKLWTRLKTSWNTNSRSTGMCLHNATTKCSTPSKSIVPLFTLTSPIGQYHSGTLAERSSWGKRSTEQVVRGDVRIQHLREWLRMTRSVTTAIIDSLHSPIIGSLLDLWLASEWELDSLSSMGYICFSLW